MGSFKQVSFYHICGPAEQCTWLSPGTAPRDPTFTVDFSRVMTTEESDPLGTIILDLHYQSGTCMYCSDPNHARTPLKSRDLEDRRALWSFFVNELNYQEVHEEVRLEVIQETHLEPNRSQLCRELSSSAEMRHSAIANEILEELEEVANRL